MSAISSNNNSNSDKNNNSNNSGTSGISGISSYRPKTTTNIQNVTNISKTSRTKDLVGNLIDADILKSKNVKTKEKEMINKSTELYETNTPKNDIVRRLKQNLNSKGFVDFPIKNDKSKLTSTFITKSQSKDSENRESVILSSTNYTNSTPRDTPRETPR